MTEILGANPASKIRILAVNDEGDEAGNDLAVEGRTIPLLQDSVEVSAWTSWAVTYRDVVVLDGDGNALGRFNLTDHNLDVLENYDLLLDYLRAVAGE